MARKDHGDPLLNLKRQPGRKLTEDQYGVLRGTVNYKIDAGQAMSKRPRIGSPHPDTRSAEAWENTVIFGNNRVAEIVTQYMGISGNRSEYEVEYLGNVGEDPIETHPSFNDLIEDAGGEGTGKAVFDNDGLFIGFGKDSQANLAGVRGYFVPSIVIRVNSFTKSPINGLSDLATIKAIPSGADVDEPGGDYNFLKTNYFRSPFGLFYRESEEFMLSGPAGWNSNIYQQS